MNIGILSKQGYVPLHVRDAEELVIYDRNNGVKKVQLYGIKEKEYPGLELLSIADKYGIKVLYTGQKLRGIKLRSKFTRYIKGKRNIAAQGRSVEDIIRQLEQNYESKGLVPQTQ